MFTIYNFPLIYAVEIITFIEIKSKNNKNKVEKNVILKL